MSEMRSSRCQRELLNFIDGFIRMNGYGPSYREIMRALDYKSVSTVAVHVDGLISKGYLRKRDRSARSLEVVSMQIDNGTKSKTSAPTPAQEKWLVSAASSRFDKLDDSHDPAVLDELYVLVGALKVLGLDGAHVAMKSRLSDYLKKHKQ
jgi:hypothetical protein